MLSRKVILDNNIRFYEDVRYGEDLLFLTNYFLSCRGIILLHEYLYKYRDREDSAMHSRRDVKDKVLSLEAKERIIAKLDEFEKEFYREKWQGQTVLIALNGTRMIRFGEVTIPM